MQVMTTMTDVSLNHAMFSQKHQVRGAMEIALFIQNIQEERAEVALFIFINQVPRFLFFRPNLFPFQTNTAHKPRDNMSLASSSRREGGFGDSGNIKVSLLHGKCFSWQERFRKTDRALEEVPTWPNVGQLCIPDICQFFYTHAF